MEGGPGDEQMYSGDIYIQSVAGFFKTMDGYIWEKGVADDFAIAVDYSVFQVYVRKLQDFLNDTLRVQNDQLAEDKYEWNPQLNDMFKDSRVRSFIVEEVTIPKSVQRQTA